MYTTGMWGNNLIWQLFETDVGEQSNMTVVYNRYGDEHSNMTVVYNRYGDETILDDCSMQQIWGWTF